jgi:hypothetical protein
MASAQPRTRRGPLAWLLDQINPLKDPSFVVAIVLTIIIVLGQHGTSIPQIALTFVVAWLAVKSAVWFFVNTIFSLGFLARKAWWVVRHPRLAWRLLDALGTEEIIVGGLHPDMFITESGGMQEAQIGRMVAAGGPMGGYGAPSYEGGYGAYTPYTYDQAPPSASQPSTQFYAELDRIQQVLQGYEQLIYDWVAFTEEKWRAVSDSQLGWKPLRGRWSGWDEIYSDSYAARTNDRMARAAAAAGEALRQRFENARSRGSAASSVACFLRDLDTLRQSLNLLSGDPGGSQTGYPAPGSPSVSQRTGKTPIIRNPRVVDAN